MISIIVPVYNAAATLRQCLAAVSASDFTDYEVIVVDDGSSDGSPALAQGYGARVLSTLDGPHGPAYARNQGAAEARGDILLFLDADVVIRPDTLGLLSQTFTTYPDSAAVFGSYDDSPAAPGFVSQYKNLFHHFVHQQARDEGGTFWTGCGAVRRDVFLRLGGFDAHRYPRPSIEDIEFGGRLRAASYPIRLNKAVQVKHLKQWSLASMIKSDVIDRAIPWTRLILRERHLPDDLNTRLSQRVSAALVCGVSLLGLGALGGAWPLDAWALLALATIVTVVLLNRRLYQFFWRARGPLFTLAIIPLHLLYYIYSVVAFAIGAALTLWDGVRREPARSL
jgi:glycosyltransferase involved in cell wall biosynthesis